MGDASPKKKKPVSPKHGASPKASVKQSKSRSPKQAPQSPKAQSPKAQSPKAQSPKARARAAQDPDGPDIPDAFVEFGGALLWAADDEAEAERVVSDHCKICKKNGVTPLVGLDFEWPWDRFGNDNPLALVQISTFDKVVLAPVLPTATELPAWVRSVLLDRSIQKVVAGFDVMDRHKLGQKGLECGEGEDAWLDISVLAEQLGDQVPSIGLRKLCYHYGYPIRKDRKVCMGDWSAPILAEDQKQYAADDAFFQLLVCGHLLEMLDTADLNPAREQALASWRFGRSMMLRNQRDVGNADFVRDFWALRNAVLVELRDRMEKACGVRAWIVASHLASGRNVRLALKQTNVSLNKTFVRQNRDILEMRKGEERGDVLVRLRAEKSSGEAEQLFASVHDEELRDRALAALEAAQPGWIGGNQLSIAAPGKEAARLGGLDLARLEKTLALCDKVELAWEEEHWMARLRQHPRAVAPNEVQAWAEAELQKRSVPSAALALRGDEKAMASLEAVSDLERDSFEEASLRRTLFARIRIISDAHAIGVEKAALEECKAYRKALGALCGLMRRSGDGNEQIERIAAAEETLRKAIDEVRNPPKRRRTGS